MRERREGERMENTMIKLNLRGHIVDIPEPQW
jgi:hypothetical protein